MKYTLKNFFQILKAGDNMDNKSNKMSNTSMNLGGTIIIIIFVVLCLAVFSFLSFNTAYSDLKLAKKSEVFYYDYYRIQGIAEERLAEIYVTLMSINEKLSIESTKETFMNNAAESVVKIYGISVINLNDESLVLYYETLGDKNQKLCVTLKVMYDEAKNLPYYDIETWNLAPIEEPVYEEETLDLWEGF